METPIEIDDELGSKLHDRSTLGKPLSAEEQAQLQAWYDKWNQIEMAQLGFTPEQLEIKEAQLAVQRAKVTADMEVLAEIVRLNQLLTRQNQELRTEIESLQSKLAKRASAKPSQSSQLSQLALKQANLRCSG